MRYFYIILSLIASFVLHQSIADSHISRSIQPGGVITAAIDSPSPGQAVRGAVVIRGSNAVEGFRSYELDFTYSADPTQSWYMIQENTEPIQDGIMAVWDTNNLTDGDYNLRLLIYKTDGTWSAVTVAGIQVQNHAPLENSVIPPTVMHVTLGPATPNSTSAPPGNLQAEATPLPSTPTPLPVNPAEISAPQVMETFGKGAALSIGVFVLLGAYIGIRTYLHGRK